MTDDVVELNPNMATDIVQRVAAEANRIAEEEAEAKRLLEQRAAEAEARIAQERAEAEAAERAAWSAKIVTAQDFEVASYAQTKRYKDLLAQDQT